MFRPSLGVVSFARGETVKTVPPWQTVKTVRVRIAAPEPRAEARG